MYLKPQLKKNLQRYTVKMNLIDYNSKISEYVLTIIMDYFGI